MIACGLVVGQRRVFTRPTGSRHQRLIKLPILRGRQVRVMPEQGESAAVAQGPLLESQHQLQGRIGIAQAQVPLGDHRTFHNDQRALAQCEGAALHHVVQRVFAAGASRGYHDRVMVLINIRISLGFKKSESIQRFDVNRV